VRVKRGRQIAADRKQSAHISRERDTPAEEIRATPLRRRYDTIASHYSLSLSGRSVHHRLLAWEINARLSRISPLRDGEKKEERKKERKKKKERICD